MENPTAATSTRQSRDMFYPEPTGSMLNGTMPNRIPIEINRRSTAVATQRLPFEIFINGTEIVAAAGVIDGVSIETVSEETAEGTWYLEGKVVIDASSGVKSGHDVYWTETLSTDTATNFFIEIGSVDFQEEGVVTTQFTYGPIIAVVHGMPDSKWGVTLY